MSESERECQPDPDFEQMESAATLCAVLFNARNKGQLSKAVDAQRQLEQLGVTVCLDPEIWPEVKYDD